MSDLAFPIDEYRRRVAAVQAATAARGLDALLLTNLARICYLTGLESFALSKFWACLLLPTGDPILITQDFESHNVGLTSWLDAAETYAIGADPIATTAELLTRYNLPTGSIGLDMGPLASMSLADCQRLHTALPAAQFRDANDAVGSIAAVKSPLEIACLREAARISSASMAAAIESAHEGATDNDVAAAAAATMFRLGSEYPCYPPIVTVGRNSGVPHSTFRRARITRGDSVFMEFGACFRRYSAPIMRTAVVGESSAVLVQLFEACRRSVEATIQHLRPGAIAGDVADAAARALGPLPAGWVWHGIHAYSVGLGFPPEWNDADVLVTRGSTTVLQAGLVFHCTTSIRNPGVIGATCGETVLITGDGCEVLTDLPRELFVR